MKFISSLASFGKINYKTAYLLIPIVVLAFILRIYGLGEENYWADEFITLRAAEGSLDSIISGNRPPLYLLIAHFWIEFFGTSENVTRLLSVFFGIASILLIYSIGKSLLGVKVGILSAFFMSVSQYQIYYSQEFRYYSLFLLLTLISFFFYIRVLKAKRNIYAVIYVLSSILLYYAHDFGIFIIAAQNLYFIINFKSLRFIILTWLLSQIIILLGILPGLIFSINYKVVGPGGIDWLEAPEIWTPFITFNYYLGAGFDYPPIKAIVIAFIFLLTGTFLYSYIIGKERWLESLRSFTEALKSLKNRKSEILLVGLWLIVPISMALVISEIIKPIYHHRYLMCSAPAFYILTALVLTKVKKIIPISIILITYVILISPGLYDYYSKPVREHWKQVAAYVAEHERPEDLIVFTSQRSSLNFKWYYRGNSKDCTVFIKSLVFLDAFDVCKPDNDRFWVVVRGELSEKDKESFLNIKKSPFRIVEEKEFAFKLESQEMPRSIYILRLTLYLFEEVGDNSN